MMIKISDEIIEQTLKEARSTDRKRAMHLFHNKEDILQRMINAMMHGTYVQPHIHQDPDKLEIFSILRGEVGVLTFDNKGGIEDKVLLRKGGTLVTEIPPRTWHSLVVLSTEAVVYEIIEGLYNPLTHKVFASWAPPEGSSKVQEYLGSLRDHFYM